MLGRFAVMVLASAVGMGLPVAAVAVGDEAYRAREEDVYVLSTVDDDDDDTNTGDTGDTSKSNTTAERSRSLDKSRDRTGDKRWKADRSNSKDASRDKTADHSKGTTTN